MYSQAAHLCFVVVVVLVVICTANPVGKPNTATVNEPHPTKDVFGDVAKILNDANPKAKKDSLVSRKKSKEPGVKMRHQKHKRHNPREQIMLQDAPGWDQSDGGARLRPPRQWRPEWSAPQATPYNMYPYSSQVLPQTYDYRHYTGHQYYSYPYSGYTNWYANQMPNYKAYNLPPESEWKTTIHEAPDVEWTAHIALPDMEPIILTSKNYTSYKSNVKVIINKSEPENGRGVDNRHIPIPGPRPVDPNSRSSNQYSYSPPIVLNENKKKKNKHIAYEPVSWTAQIDYPNSPPVVYNSPSPQASYPQRPREYVNPPPPISSGQGYYYPYNPAPPQWPAPVYNNIPWVMSPAPYQVIGNPSMAYQWPSVQVSYPNVNTNNVPQYHVPSQSTYTYPSYETKPLVEADSTPTFHNGGDGDDDDDDDGEDEDTSDDHKGDDDESDEKGKEEDQEADSEAEDYEEATAAPDSDEEDDVPVETTTKKSLFIWG